MKVDDIVTRLKKKALKSSCHYSIAAIGLDYRNKPICIKFNHPRFSRKGGGMHAELNVMRNSPKSLRRIIICRMNLNGETLPIDPCSVCLAKARELGVTIETLR